MLTVIFLLVAVMISYFIGYKTAYDNFEHGLEQNNLVHETFYAEPDALDADPITRTAHKRKNGKRRS